MCSNTKQIKNRTTLYKNGLDKPYITVDCGTCDSCRVKKQLDFYTRCYSEYKYYIENGGRVLFITLTYNDFYVPSYQISINSKQFEIPCFSVDDRQRFIKRVRRFFEYHFGYSPECFEDDKLVFPIKYFISCEYGEKYKRPHYHALLFFPPSVKPLPSNFHFLVGNCWRYIRDKDRKFAREIGFYFFSKDKKDGSYRPYVESFKCLKYVSKYITKDLSYFNNEKVNSFLNAINKLDDFSRKEYLSYFSSYCPRPLISNNFGSPLLYDFKKHFENYVKKGVPVLENKVKYYSLPYYIIRKACFNIVKNPFTNEVRSYINSFGQMFFNFQFHENLNKCVKSLEKKLSLDWLRAHSVNSIPSNVQRHLYTILGNFSLRDVALFKYGLSGYSYTCPLFEFHKRGWTFFDNLEQMVEYMFYHRLKKRTHVYFTSVKNNRVYSSDFYNSSIDFDSRKVFDNLPYFRPIVLFLQKIQELSNNLIDSCAAATISKQTNITNLKQFYYA